MGELNEMDYRGELTEGLLDEIPQMETQSTAMGNFVG